MTSAKTYDCCTCGACCVNPDKNRAEGSVDYVMIDDEESRLLSKPALAKRHVRFDARGTAWLRIDQSGRCTALEGKLGKRVKCVVYANRPRGCRIVEPGTPECLAARKERGIE